NSFFMSRLVCLCNKVTQKEIALIVSKFPHATLPDVINKTAASTSCGRCKSELQDVFKKLKSKYSSRANNSQQVIPFDFEAR
ncbi:MAG: (2Fe-2S)-binding protein, partial [Bacteroidota bacterium]